MAVIHRDYKELVTKTKVFLGCDYCGKEVEGNKPNGWARITVKTSESSSFSSDVCDECCKKWGVLNESS